MAQIEFAPKYTYSRFIKTVWLLLIAMTPLKLQADERPVIVVNQAGYLSDWPKRAALVYFPDQVESVSLVRAETDEVVNTFKPVPSPSYNLDIEEPDSQLVDFSEISKAGQYYLQAGDSRSSAFNIGTSVYKEPTRLLLRSYYLQRCGVELLDAETGLAHEACHLNDGVYARDDAINKAGLPHDGTGGWHDAGDYGKYIAPASVTVNRLLSLYLMSPNRYPDNALGIPESGNEISDLLDEVKVELDWMLRMQRADGAVYRKLSGAKWPSVIPPKEDTQARYVYGVSSPETGKFIASMAIAYRAYKDIDSDLAKQYLQAAEKSWAWLKQQPEQTIDWQKSDDSGSGGYIASDTDVEVQLGIDRDDRLTAAIELYLSTNRAEFRDFILENEPQENYSLYEWKDASSLSLWHLMREDQSAELKATRQDIQGKLLGRAELLVQQTETSSFKVANDRIIWGSNKMTAEEGITLAHAWQLTGEEQYLRAALDQLDFVFGKNPFNKSFVTAVGERSVKNPVHIFGRSIKKTLPGLLVGGPNAEAQDGIAPKHRGLMSYVDHERAYSVNEYAIDYNASIIGLLEVLAIYKESQEKQTLVANKTRQEATPDIQPDIVKIQYSDTNEDDDPTQTENSETPRKVLFIGNSFTYYNNSLHYHVETLRRNTMSVKDFAPYNFRAATIAGGFWYEQLANVDTLTEGKAWDAAILQGHSREAIDDDKKLIFKDSLRESRDLLVDRGVKPFLFMTWAYRHAPEMIEQLEPAYQSLADELDMTLVPVGTAFKKALAARPSLQLHAKDGIHPSRAGTYLSACVFYAALYGESPVGLRYDMGLGQEAARFLQQVAKSVVMPDYNQLVSTTLGEGIL